MAKEKGKSLAIFSAKGGVGKSTCVLNLAGIISLLGKKVLIIDFDASSGAIAAYLNKPFKKTIYNFVDDYANNRFENIKEYTTKFNDNISFISCCKDPRQGVKISSSYIELVIEKAVYEYDYVLVDTNHVLSEFNITLLDNVDETLLVMTNDLVDIKNMHNLIKIFKDANKTNYKVLLNESINPHKNYYALYDIKSIIKTNIDYTIGSNFFLKTMDTYIAGGEILTLDKKFPKVYPKIYKTFVAICMDLNEVHDEK